MKLNNNDLQSFEELPKGWAIAMLGEILPLTYGKALKKAVRDELGKVPVYGSSGQVGVHSQALTTRPALIIGRKGSVGEVYRSMAPCWPIDTVYFVEERSGIDLNYFEYVLKGLKLSRLDKSTAVPGLSRDDYNAVQVAIAPLDQQKRIVAEIEKQFSRLDEGIGDLKRVQANLKRYKAAVLKAAVEGRLVETEAEIARREGRDYETGEQLLQRILQERRRRWEEAELAKMQAKGKPPKNDKWKQKYKEPTAPDTTNLPKLPEGWVWATLPQLGELARGKSKHRPRDDDALYGGPYPFIQTGDVRRSEGSISEYTQTYSELGLSQSRLWPTGTLCITIAANIAETGILNFSACFPDSVVGFISALAQVTTCYVELFIRTAKEDLERFAPATAQKNINLKVLEAVAIPLPPLAEQHRIVTEVDRRLSILRETEAQVEANLQRAERLRQSILAAAFSGRLVSDDTLDPAA